MSISPARTTRPTTLFGHLSQALKAIHSLLTGLGITGKNFVDSQRTVHYPRQTVSDDHMHGYRGHIELVPHPKDPERHRCIVCFKCMRACPSQCIHIEKLPRQKPQIDDDAREMHGLDLPIIPRRMLVPEQARSRLKSFSLDFTLCSLCGHCVQLCPAKAIRHSNNVYLASTTSKDFHFDLLARMHEQTARTESQEHVPEKHHGNHKEAI